MARRSAKTRVSLPAPNDGKDKLRIGLSMLFLSAGDGPAIYGDWFRRDFLFFFVFAFLLFVVISFLSRSGVTFVIEMAWNWIELIEYRLIDRYGGVGSLINTMNGVQFWNSWHSVRKDEKKLGPTR